MPEQFIQAKCVDKAFDSRNAIQYYPGDVVRIIYNEKDRQDYRDINLSDPHQRKLVWLKTLGKRWVFDFDRSAASNPSVRIFFCKECGQPFDKFTEMGNHAKEAHKAKKDKAAIEEALAIDADEAEEQALAALRAAEEAEDAKAQPAQA